MQKIYWQAHRGGSYEMPQNTIASIKYGWDLDAIVEVDIRTTKDNKIIILHNSTLKDTTNAPEEYCDIDVKNLTYEEIYQFDAGVIFDKKYKGERIPLLTDLFILMQQNKKRQLYLDLKDVNLKDLANLIKEYKVEEQCIFCHCDINNCIEIKNYVDIRCMLWIGGSEKEIINKFETIKKSKFFGTNQVQLHLNSQDKDKEWIYDLSIEFLQYALKETTKYSIDLELFPWEIKESNIKEMLDMKFTWFCTDYPMQFQTILNNYFKKEV